MGENEYRTYDPAEFGYAAKKGGGWKKGLLIFLLIVLAIALLGWGASRLFSGSEKTYEYNTDYIGILHVEGTIMEEAQTSPLAAGGGYDHEFFLERLAKMEEDPHNKGILLFINSPGGSVYASDEAYLKLEEYKEKTGRPVYTYMASEAASGGYYIAAASDKILANRNCWTGSIGVLIGTLYDVSDLLDKLGVSAVNITSGANKAMGSSVEKMTKEQKAIFQGLVDEAYDQFVGIVAKGRKMDEKVVRKLADGRIYTAKQALDNGLIDGICQYEEAKEQMKQDLGLETVSFEDMEQEYEFTLTDYFMMGQAGSLEEETSLEDPITALLSGGELFTITYMTNVRK